ncbi:MAG: hypothetical protein ACI4V1_09500, partial [Eubacteriales bacterium]
MLAYNREFLLIDAFTRVYDHVFDETRVTADGALPETEHPQILCAEPVRKLEGKVQLVYEHSNMTLVPLFGSYLETVENRQKRRGNYYTYFTYSERLEMIFQLCGIFEELEHRQIALHYPSDDMLLWDTEEKTLYFDLVPAVLARTPENQALEYRMNKEYYWPLLPETAFEGGSRCRFAGEVRNRILLNLLIFRLMTGEDWYNWNWNKEDMAAEPAVSRASGGLVDESFTEMLCELTQWRFVRRDLRKIPTAEFWRAKIASLKRCISGQILRSETCNAGGRKKIGEIAVKSTGVTLPLLAPSADYKASDFGWDGDAVQMRIR